MTIIMIQAHLTILSALNKDQSYGLSDLRNSAAGVFCAQFPRPAYVAADLAVTPLKEALTAKGFDPSKPALFTCEGILTYLPQVEPSDHLHPSLSLSRF